MTTVRAWGVAHRVGGVDRDVDKPGEASNWSRHSRSYKLSETSDLSETCHAPCGCLSVRGERHVSVHAPTRVLRARMCARSIYDTRMRYALQATTYEYGRYFSP